MDALRQAVPGSGEQFGPPGDRIRMQRTGDELALALRRPRRTELREKLTVALMGLWLCAWALGEGVVVRGILDPETSAAAAVFLVLWVIGWAFYGLVVMRRFLRLLVGPRPERLVLTASELRLEPAWPEARVDAVRIDWSAPEARPLRFPVQALRTLRLDRLEGRQRLTVDGGDERVEIGASLSDPEREWLSSMLRAWDETHLAFR